MLPFAVDLFEHQLRHYILPSVLSTSELRIDTAVSEAAPPKTPVPQRPQSIWQQLDGDITDA